MSLVFDVKTLKSPDSELVKYLANSEHPVRNLKITPTSITFQDTPQNNNYAKFTIDPEDGSIISEVSHLSFQENNENSNNEVWRNIPSGEWIDEFEIVELIEQHVIGTNGGSRKRNRTRKNVRKARKSRKNKWFSK